MINLINIIKDNFLVEEFNTIDAKIICESLNCKILQDLAKQLKDIKDEEDDRIEKEYQKDLEKYGNYASKSSNYNRLFKYIFGGGNIRWDKISDDDIEHIYYGNEKNNKIEKRIREVINSKSDNIILIKDNEDKDFLYVIYTWGEVYKLFNSAKSKKWGDYAGQIVKSNNFKKMPAREKIELCKDKNLYFIDVHDKKEEYSKLRLQRNLNKSGMIMMDPDSLKDIARKNIERYKEILRKKRATNLNNDEVLNKCKKIINLASKYAIMVAKDPIRHADLISLVSTLSKWIYDKRTYNYTDTRRLKGYYSGVNGLLPLISKYTELVKDLSKNGGYEHQQESLRVTQDEINKSIERAEELINQIESKIND